MTRPFTPPAPACACPPGALTHPLEMFPVARRWRRSVARDVVYTFVWNTLVALVFTGMSTLFDSRGSVIPTLQATFVIAQCIGFVIHVLFAVGDRLLPDMHTKPLATRFAYYSSIPLIGVVAGYPIAAHLLGWRDFLSWLLTPRTLASMVFLSVLISGILLAIFVQRERAARAEVAVAREQARVAAAERAATLAQLKLLEAQIEPHFLYNTLAHVVSLVDHDARAARRMLEQLIVLLRATAAVPDRAETLGAQVDWLSAYLAILELRLGRRLAWHVDVPEALREVALPPMLLQPVVENAVKHGIEPKIEGGRIDIVARHEGQALRITVRDTGLGFTSTAPASRASLGLANLRARLAALFAGAARLVIEDNHPTGAAVSLFLPLEGAAERGAPPPGDAFRAIAAAVPTAHAG